MEIWILTSLLAAIFSSFEKIAHRYNMMKVDDIYSYTISFQFICAVITIPVVVTNPVFPSESRMLAYGWLGLAAICWALFSLLTFHADKHLEASIKSGISRLRIVWTGIIGWGFFNEPLSSYKVSGIVLILTAPFLISKVRGNGTALGFILEMSASIMIALALTFDKVSANYFSEPIIVLLSFLNSAILILLIRKGRFDFQLSLVRLALPAALFSTLCYLFLIYSLKHGEISIVISVYMTSPVMVTFLAIYLLQEKHNIRLKVLSAVIATTGCFLTIH